MNLPLHDDFNLGNFERFRQTLSNTRKTSKDAFNSSSLSKSPRWDHHSQNVPPPLSNAQLNRYDPRGRTVLHLISASVKADAIDYLEVLLNCPGVNVNLPDKESGWTALHR